MTDVGVRATFALRGRRWGFGSTAEETWMLVEVDGVPRGARLRRDGDGAVAYEVGGFVVFVGADQHMLFTVPEEDVDLGDGGLLAEWLKAGRPRLRSDVASRPGTRLRRSLSAAQRAALDQFWSLGPGEPLVHLPPGMRVTTLRSLVRLGVLDESGHGRSRGWTLRTDAGEK